VQSRCKGRCKAGVKAGAKSGWPRELIVGGEAEALADGAKTDTGPGGGGRYGDGGSQHEASYARPPAREELLMPAEKRRVDTAARDEVTAGGCNSVLTVVACVVGSVRVDTAARDEAFTDRVFTDTVGEAVRTRRRGMPAAGNVTGQRLETMPRRGHCDWHHRMTSPPRATPPPKTRTPDGLDGGGGLLSAPPNPRCFASGGCACRRANASDLHLIYT
jgi:hypothetical protein